MDRDKILFNPPPLGCVLYLPGLPGAGSTIYDRSPHGNNGTITTAAWTRSLGGLWYLNFDGTNDNVDCGKPASLSLTGDLTIAFWALITAAGGKHLMGNFNVAGNKAQYDLLIGNNLRWQSLGDTALDFTAVMGFSVGVWGCVGVTINGSAHRTFSNGIFVEQNTIIATDRCAENLRGNTFWGTGGDFDPAEFAGGIALQLMMNRGVSDFWMSNFYHRTKHLFGIW